MYLFIIRAGMTGPSLTSPCQGNMLLGITNKVTCMPAGVCSLSCLCVFTDWAYTGLPYFESYHLFCLFALPSQSEQTLVLQDPYRDASIFLVT